MTPALKPNDRALSQTAQREVIAAVIVTHNRLAMLQQTVNAVHGQSRRPDIIIVVNNASTDGTAEWLKNVEFTTVVTQENTGSSGGQFTGLRVAFDLNPDWIWCMDDDVVPAPDCLEQLLGNSNMPVRVPLRIAPDGAPQFGVDTIRFNFSNPFAGLWAEMLAGRHIGCGNIYVEGPSFEGPLIHCSVVEAIGLPDKDFFIFADDSDFFIRSHRAGFRAELVASAKLHRLLPFSMQKTAEWKRYYEIRNIVTLDKRYGSMAVKLFRPLYYAAKMWLGSESGSERRAVIQGFLHGITGRLGRL